MVSKRELRERIDELIEERQEARSKLLGAEGKIAQLKEQLESYRSVGEWNEYLLLTVELDNRADVVAQKKQIGLIRELVESEFTRIGIKAKPIILSDRIKSVYPHSEEKGE